MIVLYITVTLFVISALASGVCKSTETSFDSANYITISGTISGLLGLIALLFNSFRGV